MNPIASCNDEIQDSGVTPLKILSIFGTRPEAIKMAPVVRELAQPAHRAQFHSVVCVTAQHREMLDQVLRLFDVCPDYDLDLMRENQSLASLTARVLEGLDPIVAREAPDWLLVQGDTTTVLAAALAGYYHRVRVGHVEAGLRTGNKYHPYPEEINRRVASCLGDLHFAPTETARANLLREGIAPETIRVTGNPVIDALQWVVSLPFDLDRLGIPELADPRCRVVLLTAHRRENFGKPIEDICQAVRELAERYQGRLHIVYPVHLNPNIQEPVKRLLSGVDHVSLIPPLDYLALVHLMKRAELVLTDSGGIQEEAPGLGKPVLVLREVTERPEAVAAGTVRVVGTDRDRIVAEAVRLLDDRTEYDKMARAVNPYGDGHAAERICQALLEVSRDK